MYLYRAFSPSNHPQLRALPRAIFGPQKTYRSLFGATKESGEGANQLSPGQRPGKGVIRKKGQGLKAPLQGHSWNSGTAFQCRVRYQKEESRRDG